MQYRVYQDGKLIATTDQKTYKATGLKWGYYTFGVSAYNGKRESTQKTLRVYIDKWTFRLPKYKAGYASVMDITYIDHAFGIDFGKEPDGYFGGKVVYKETRSDMSWNDYMFIYRGGFMDDFLDGRKCVLNLTAITGQDQSYYAIQGNREVIFTPHK